MKNIIRSITSKIPRLPISSKKAKQLIVLLVFMNIGVYAVAISNADAYTTRFIIFCARNECRNTDTNNLNKIAHNIEGWFGQQTGRSFTRRTSAVVVYGQQNASFYGAGRYSSEDTFTRILFELTARGIVNPSTKVVAQLGFRSMSNCGMSGYNLQLALSDPYIPGKERCAFIQDSILAHEIGHTVYGNGHLYDGTLMSNSPIACNYQPLSNCRINAGQIPQTGNNPWMNQVWGSSKTPPPVAPAPPAQPPTAPTK